MHGEPGERRVSGFSLVQLSTFSLAQRVSGACCILHNVCVAVDDILGEEEEEEEEEEAGQGEDDRENDLDKDAYHRELSGIHIRARLAAQLSGERKGFPA
ncbi:hypothetical protein F2P81_023815 [Scophthalmus maximus]|uniref:Uncharacterized protein n=1 Tax=Scophthalmus maximus TaxID=52904 RepID=A0A6A4RSN5_SCOMX|nr:hypothetical protein F2P81_023815 [Scophthalmus maximus]